MLVRNPNDRIQVEEISKKIKSKKRLLYEVITWEEELKLNLE